MESANKLEHSGIVQHTYPGFVTVKIISQSACHACHAKGSCTMADVKDKEIEVPVSGQHYCRGDKVRVLLKRSLGYQAVFFAYFLPFLIFLGTMIIAVAFSASELLSGLMAMAILIPYYLVLHQFNGSIKKKFNFIIEQE